MKEIRIGPVHMAIGSLAVIGAITAAVVAQLPELRRYLRVRAMD